MVKVSIVIDKRYKMKNDCYPIKIRVTRKGRTFYVGTDIEVKEEEWDSAARKVVKRRDKSALNYRLQAKLSAIQTKISDLQLKGELRNFTTKRLQSYLNDGSNEKASHLLYKTQCADFLSHKDNKRTIQIYEATTKHIENFCDIDSLLLTDIDIDWLNKFVTYLRTQGCNSANTRAIHLRNIRAVINYAHKRKVINDYVFAEYRIVKEETVKRSLAVDDLRKLYNVPLDKNKAMYRDIFFLIFFLMGINLIDLSRLTEIVNGRISYKRAKTGTLYDIRVEPEAQEIIDRYRGQKHLIDVFDRYKNYNDFKSRFNKNLKDICGKIGIEANVSTYWARHSFATLAYEIGLSMDIIADCLGHKSAQNRITQIYVRKDQKRIDEANRKVINYLIYNKV